MQIVAQIICKLKILYKALVLDLDETLWKGTLSEVGIANMRENMCSEQGAPFIAFMNFVKTLANELGIFIAICSRNDSKLVESTIKELDDSIFPIKNQIDYIIANNNDKSENIRKTAEQLTTARTLIVNLFMLKTLPECPPDGIERETFKTCEERAPTHPVFNPAQPSPGFYFTTSEALRKRYPADFSLGSSRLKASRVAAFVAWPIPITTPRSCDNRARLSSCAVICAWSG